MKTSVVLIVLATSAICLPACTGDSEPAEASEETDTGSPTDLALDEVASSDATIDQQGADTVLDRAQNADSSEPTCDLPTGYDEILLADGDGMFTINDAGWTIADTTVAETPLWEAIGFDLPSSGTVHGFSVEWADTMEDKASIQAGLFPDFGHNGFDFWQYEAYWEGPACEHSDTSGWTTYQLQEPHRVEQPGLVYVAHWRETVESPVWLLDQTFDGDGDCAVFADCHSAINMPSVQAAQQYNGTGFSIPYDFRVKLLWTPDDPVEEHVFEAQGDLVPRGHSSWGDYDNDGDDDLYTAGQLWQNQGDGSFVDVSTEAGLAYGSGVWGDYDNDGCLDMLAFSESHRSSERLFHSLCDGTFENVTEASGLTDVQTYNDCEDPENTRTPTAAAAWWDIDNDGLLDIYLANLMCWDNYSYYVDAVWHNEGDGVFSDWSREHGFATYGNASRGASPIDYDQDGDVDMFVNTYVLQRNVLFVNQGDGTVREKAEDLNLEGTPARNAGVTRYGHTIAAAWGDLDGDGDFDQIQANLAHPRFFRFSDKTRVMLQRRRGGFEDIQGDWSYPAGAAGIRYQETHSVPILADFDSDGALDLVISAVYDGRPTDFYWGNGDGTFELDVLRAGIDVTNGWGMAIADYDNDGAVDFSTRGALYTNVWQPVGDAHWLQVRAIGNVDSNRWAIGATVRVQTAESLVIRHVSGGSGQGDQDSATLHFGLGSASEASTIEVDFPGGGTVQYEGPFDLDQRIWLFEDGTTHTGWAPPE